MVRKDKDALSAVEMPMQNKHQPATAENNTMVRKDNLKDALSAVEMQMQNKHLNATASSLLKVSAKSGPLSGSKNLPQASENIAKLSDYIRALDLEDGTAEQVGGGTLSRWIQHAEAYAEAERRTFDTAEPELEAYTLDDHQMSLVRLAALATNAVYTPFTLYKPSKVDETKYDMAGWRPVPINEKSSRLAAGVGNGCVKAAKATLLEPLSDLAAGNTDRRWPTTLVVAIRGSVTSHDWVVNLNFKDSGRSGNSFLGGEGGPYTVHSGFLSCAQDMVRKTAETIKTIRDSYLAENRQATGVPPLDLVWTGHSAGGAVAALLYAHMMQGSRNQYTVKDLSELKDEFRNIHCITFAAPPGTTPGITSCSPGNLFLSVFHEGDPVPRLDEAYTHWLMGLYMKPGGRATTAPPPRERGDAGVPLLLRCRFGDEEQQHQPGAVSLFQFNTSGSGSLEWAVMGNPRRHSMDEYLASLRMAG